MRWLIVEDALRDRKGHWFEYLGTFARELTALGDDVTILGDRAAEPFLREQLAVRPVLPDSIWHRMGDGAGPLRRYLRVPGHAWNTFRAMKNFLRGGEKFDLIFVPTVLVHHLLGWQWLIKRVLPKTSSRVLLFFPNTPITLNETTGAPAWQTAPTAKLFNRLIRSLRTEVAQGRVILGAETHPMCAALSKLTGVKFTYLPHPVAPSDQNDTSGSKFTPRPLIPAFSPGGGEGGRRPDEGEHAASKKKGDNEIVFGSYGSARHEKGPDILVPAVENFCRQFPETKVRFALQCVDGDQALWKRLDGNPNVRLIPEYFPSGGYAKQLGATDALLLPYRRSSYALRVSRVVIEALVQGLPVVTTTGTTLGDQAKEFGAATFCQDGEVESLVQAIGEMEKKFSELSRRAQERKAAARAHFSVAQFREILTA